MRRKRILAGMTLAGLGYIAYSKRKPLYKPYKRPTKYKGYKTYR